MSDDGFARVLGIPLLFIFLLIVALFILAWLSFFMDDDGGAGVVTTTIEAGHAPQECGARLGPLTSCTGLGPGVCDLYYTGNLKECELVAGVCGEAGGCL